MSNYPLQNPIFYLPEIPFMPQIVNKTKEPGMDKIERKLKGTNVCFLK